MFADLYYLLKSLFWSWIIHNWAYELILTLIQPVFFCPENVICFLCLVLFRQVFFMEANNMNPDNQGSSLISGSILFAIEASRQLLKSLISEAIINWICIFGGGGESHQSFWPIAMYKNLKLEVHMYALTTYSFCCVCVWHPTNSLSHMETGPLLKVSSDRQVKLEIEPATPGLQGKWLIHYTTAAPIPRSIMWVKMFMA